MPFQVSLSSRRRIYGQISYVSAGADQYHICTPVVYLEAAVVGDLIGHSLLWEQLSGTPVTLFNANTLTPYFNYTDGSDKVFRFWIDKGTPEQQFDDMTVYRTPTSRTSAGFDSEQQSFTYTLDPPAVNCVDIIANVVSIVPPPTSLEGEEAGTTYNIVVSWQHPGNTITDPHIEQYRVLENGFEVDSIPPTPIATAGEIDGTAGGPPSDPLEYYGTLALYKIDTYYNIGGFKYLRESCTKDLKPPIL